MAFKVRVAILLDSSALVVPSFIRMVVRSYSRNMTRTTWRWKSSTLAFACMIAIAASGDFGPIVPATSGSTLVIIAFDEDDSNETAERTPVSASGNAVYTSLLSYVRNPRDVVEALVVGNGSFLRCAPRGPPNDRSNNLGCAASLFSRTAAVDTAIVVALHPPAIRYHTPVEVQVQALDDPSRKSVQTGIDLAAMRTETVMKLPKHTIHPRTTVRV